MRKLRKDVFLESKYPGVMVGAINSPEGVLLIDSPFRIEDAKDWQTQVSSLGQARYIALLDFHPERVLGARHFDLPILAHDHTLQEVQSWPDAFKGSSRPIGAETDHLKRITGIGRSTPEISFSEEMQFHLGDRVIRCIYRPGPSRGSIWVDVPDARIIFVGDAISISEPPYLGDADIPAWLAALDELRGSSYESYRILSARSGIVGREALNQMARFLRKIPKRLEKLWEDRSPVEDTAKVAKQLLKGYKVATIHQEQVFQRLQLGLAKLYTHRYPIENN
jgi:glyoxylase-like metal-dependent hydrolase (beta-lactamase superfamily II)